MPLLDSINRIEVRNAKAAEDLCDVLHELVTITLRLASLSYELLATADSETVSKHKTALQIARTKLNDIGNYRAANRTWEGMRRVTDMYSQVGTLLKKPSVRIERTKLGSIEFDRPIQYKKLLEIRGVTAVRTSETNRSSLGRGNADKIRDGLQVAFRLKSDIPNSQVFLRQGWIGSEAEIQNRYDSGDRGHVLGRLWDGADTHDFATQAAGDWCSEMDTLTFVAQDKVRPVFFGDKQLSLDSFAVIEQRLRDVKTAVGKSMMRHLRGAENIAMSGEVVS